MATVETIGIATWRWLIPNPLVWPLVSWNWAKSTGKTLHRRGNMFRVCFILWLLPSFPVGLQQLQQSHSLLQQEGARQFCCGQSVKFLTRVVVEYIALPWDLAPRCTFDWPGAGGLVEEYGKKVSFTTDINIAFKCSNPSEVKSTEVSYKHCLLLYGLTVANLMCLLLDCYLLKPEEGEGNLITSKEHWSLAAQTKPEPVLFDWSKTCSL